MLPLLALEQKHLAPKYRDAYGSPAVFGHSFAYEVDQLRVESRKMRFALDRYLRYHLAQGFTLHPAKQPVLVWLGLRVPCAVLGFTCRRGMYRPGWAAEIPGFFEEGDEELGAWFRPYAYWNGTNLYRLYPDAAFDPAFDNADSDAAEKAWRDPSGEVTEASVEAQEPQPFLCDLAPMAGWLVSRGDPQAVCDLRAGRHPDSWWYAFVPEEEEEIVRMDGFRCVLLHARYTLERERIVEKGSKWDGAGWP